MSRVPKVTQLTSVRVGLCIQVCLTPQASPVPPLWAVGCLGCLLGAMSRLGGGCPRNVYVTVVVGGQCRLNCSHHGLLKIPLIFTCILHGF